MQMTLVLNKQKSNKARLDTFHLPETLIDQSSMNQNNQATMYANDELSPRNRTLMNNSSQFKTNEGEFPPAQKQLQQQLENRVSSFLAGRGSPPEKKQKLKKTGNMTIISVAGSGSKLRMTQHIRGESPKAIELPKELATTKEFNTQSRVQHSQSPKVFGVKEGQLTRIDHRQKEKPKEPAPINQFLLGDFQLQSWRTLN